MKRPILLALAALSLLVPAHAVRAADKPMVYHDGARQLPAATAVQLNAATTANASVNLGQGVAPTSPADGDSWMTSAGFYYRAGGITFGPITLSSVTCGAPLTGGTITTTGTCAIATNGLALSFLAQIGGSSYLGNQSTSTGNVTAYAFPTCSAGQFLVYNPLSVPPLQCATPSTVPSGSNPFAIGSIDLTQIIGTPSASPLPAGSMAFRSDIPLPYVLLASSAAVPAVVQSRAGTGNSAVMAATPAAGHMMVAFCSNYVPTAAAASGWTLVSADNALTLIPSRTVVRKLATATESTTQTPCTGASAVMVFEVSGISDWNLQYQGQVTGTGSGSGLTLSTTTTSANTLVLGAFATRDGTAPMSMSGLTQALDSANGAAGSDWAAVGGAAGQFPTNGSGVSAAANFTTGFGMAGTLILITPGASSWAQVSYLATIQNAGSTISTLPYILNCSTGVSCAASTDANGLDKITLTATGPTGSGATGAIAKWASSTSLTTGDLSGVVTTSGGLTTSFAAVAANTMLANWTGASAAPSFSAMPGCADSSGAHLNYVSGTGITCGTSYNASPTLSALTLSAVTGSTQCLHVNSSGVLSGTGSDCGSAGGAAIHGTPTAGNCTSWFSATTIQDAGAACGGAGSSTLVAPQGRLTLVSGSPVMASDQTAKSQVFYDCYGGKYYPNYNGSIDQLIAIGSCEVSLTMATTGTGVTNSGGVFDILGLADGSICVVTNGSGGGWASDTGGSNTARGTGYSQVHNTRGYWTNANAVSHCYNGATDKGSIAADQGTYLGTLTTTAAGQTGVALKPAGASGGSNNVLGLWNAYNRVTITAIESDSNPSYTYNSLTWRAADASSANRVTWVDGLQQSSVSVVNVSRGFMNAVAGQATIGTVLDSTSATPSVKAGGGNVSSAPTLGFTFTAPETFTPQVGLHFLQRMESADAGTWNFQNAAQNLTVNIEMGLWIEPANDNAPWRLPAGFVLLPALVRRRGRRAA